MRVGLIRELLILLRDCRVSSEEDLVIWKGGDHDSFRIRDAYKLLAAPSATTFPKKSIWVDKVPTKVALFAWEATWGRSSLWIGSKNGGGTSLIIAFCVAVKKKM